MDDIAIYHSKIGHIDPGTAWNLIITYFVHCAHSSLAFDFIKPTLWKEAFNSVVWFWSCLGELRDPFMLNPRRGGRRKSRRLEAMRRERVNSYSRGSQALRVRPAWKWARGVGKLEKGLVWEPPAQARLNHGRKKGFYSTRVQLQGHGDGGQLATLAGYTTTTLGNLQLQGTDGKLGEGDVIQHAMSVPGLV